jgi:hypothetical protein
MGESSGRRAGGAVGCRSGWPTERRAGWPSRERAGGAAPRRARRPARWRGYVERDDQVGILPGLLGGWKGGQGRLGRRWQPCCGGTRGGRVPGRPGGRLSRRHRYRDRGHAKQSLLRGRHRGSWPDGNAPTGAARRLVVLAAVRTNAHSSYDVSPRSPTCRGLTSHLAPGGRAGNRVGAAGLCPAEPERGRVWEPSQGSHYYSGGLALRTKSRKYDSNHWPASGAPWAASGPPHILS